jgi:hypothetical protein
MDDFLELIDLFNRRHTAPKVVDVGKPVITTRMMPEPETVKARVGSSHTGPALAWPG